ncbi:MAG: PaaI family thioesterase [Hyphomicrobiales bacterium]
MGKISENLMWNISQVMAWMRESFPQAFLNGRDYTVEELRPGHAKVRLIVGDAHLRPGGTVSGPAMMEMVDFAAYVLLIAHHGDAARLSVTTNLAISFLRKPEAGDIICELDVLKHGKTLIVMNADIRSIADNALIGHAEMTYFNADGKS